MVVTKIVAIGNSKGVRIPKAVIQQCGLDDEVELVVRKGELVLRAPKVPRAGWDAAFAMMRQRGDGELLNVETAGKLTEWEDAEWQW
jgi:antitoxin MazE